MSINHSLQTNTTNTTISINMTTTFKTIQLLVPLLKSNKSYIQRTLDYYPGILHLEFTNQNELNIQFDASLIDEQDVIGILEQAGVECIPSHPTYTSHRNASPTSNHKTSKDPMEIQTHQQNHWIEIQIHGIENANQNDKDEIVNLCLQLEGIQQVVVNRDSVALKMIDSLITRGQVLSTLKQYGYNAYLEGSPSRPSSPVRVPETLMVSIQVQGMTCQSCVNTVTNTLLKYPGVTNAIVNLEKELANVYYESKSIRNPLELVNVIRDCGFDANLLGTCSSTVKMRASLDLSPLSVSPIVSPISPISVKSFNFKDAVELQKMSNPPTQIKIKPEIQTHGQTYGQPQNTIELNVYGMTCASCVKSIQDKLSSTKGITSVSVALLAQKAQITFDPSLLHINDIVQSIQDMGFDTVAPTDFILQNVTLRIFGMTCGSCSGTIERELRATDGIKYASVNLLGQSGTFEFDKNKLGIRDIMEKIESLGFDVLLDEEETSHLQSESLERTREIKKWRDAFYHSSFWAIPVSCISMILPLFAPQIVNYQIIPGLVTGDLLMMLLTLPVQFGIGKVFYEAAYKSLRHGSYTMDVLLVLGTSIAFTYSVLSIGLSVQTHGKVPSQVFFETSTTLICFVSWGRYLENIAKAKTTSALSKLLSLAPSHATLLLNDENGNPIEKRIPCNLIQENDLIKVKPGEKMATDGIIEFGSTTVDESLITGEPFPILKNINEIAIGGTLNLTGVVYIRAKRVGKDTALSQIIKLVTEAQTSKAPIQDLADLIASYFVPAILFLGFFTFLFWYLITWSLNWIPPSFPPESNSLFVSLSFAISVIVVACPCALGLATPTAVMVGTGIGAKLGILIKGGRPLELAHQVNTVIFDKTGTLTTGKMGVVAVHVTESRLNSVKMSTCQFISLVGAVEANSEHPIGKSIHKYAQEYLNVDIFPFKIMEFESIAGLGIVCVLSDSSASPTTASPTNKSLTNTGKGTGKGTIIGQKVLVGNKTFLSQHGIEIPSHQLDLGHVHELKGHSVVYAAMNSELIGMIAVADLIRPESKTVVLALERMGAQVLMVTGDQETTASVIARQCGIQTVHATVSPGGKKRIVQELQGQGKIVGMVGDGINDSGSLAQADIGIAVYGGTDVAVDAANIVLMRPDLLDVVVAFDLSRKILNRIWINFLFATCYNLLMLPLAMGIGIPWGIKMPTMVAGMAMSLSSVSVVTSSLLLKLYSRPVIQDNGVMIHQFKYPYFGLWNILFPWYKFNTNKEKYARLKEEEEEEDDGRLQSANLFSPVPHQHHQPHQEQV